MEKDTIIEAVLEGVLASLNRDPASVRAGCHKALDDALDKVDWDKFRTANDPVCLVVNAIKSALFAEADPLIGHEEFHAKIRAIPVEHVMEYVKVTLDKEIKKHLLKCGRPEVEAWAEKWLFDEDRTLISADRAFRAIPMPSVGFGETFESHPLPQHYLLWAVRHVVKDGVSDPGHAARSCIFELANSWAARQNTTESYSKAYTKILKGIARLRKGTPSVAE